MKSIITLIAAAFITLLGTTTPADARQYNNKRVQFSGYQSCGTPIYTERFFIGYDRCGDPIYGHRTVRSHYQPVVRPRYAPVVRRQYIAPCPAQHFRRGHHHHRNFSRNGVMIEHGYHR